MSENPQSTNQLGQKKNTRSITNAVGIGLIILGLTILFGEVFDIGIGRYLWPFIFIIPGVFMLGIANQESVKHGEPLVIIGSIVGSLGLLFLYQSITNHWVSWAYAWALIAPTSFGLGLWWYGRQRNREDHVKSGKELARIGGIIFLVGAAFFEIILGLSRYGRAIMPVLIIAVGIYLLYNAIRNR